MIKSTALWINVPEIANKIKRVRGATHNGMYAPRKGLRISGVGTPIVSKPQKGGYLVQIFKAGRDENGNRRLDEAARFVFTEYDSAIDKFTELIKRCTRRPKC